MEYNGFINLDKPTGITSARAVNTVKRLLPRGTKIGHAGTLDSFATGVLVLLIGKATRQCETVMSMTKEYQAAIKLGATTESLDPLTPEEVIDTRPIPQTRMMEILPRFTGPIEQLPPAYSALKIGGRRASDLARANCLPELKPRLVQIYALELLDYQWPYATIRVECGRGTYIRALARDLAKSIGTVGYLTTLRRTRIGNFHTDNSASLDQLKQGIEPFLQHPLIGP